MSDPAQQQPRLPSVDKVLRSLLGAALVEQYGHGETVDAIRNVLASTRESEHINLDVTTAATQADRILNSRNLSRFRPLINLTGTVLHTNLGRAVLADEAVLAATNAMQQPVALEFDLGPGTRGQRDDAVRDLLCELTGAEDALVVNNNAAAVLIALNTFAAGRGAIISRGELIEIGGAFRMPDIMACAGAKLIEVGTTNRTHIHDYEKAITAETGLIIKVHTSNYRIEGFTKSISSSDLATLAHQHDLPLLDDLGSGTLIDLTKFGLPREPTVAEAVSSGADLVTFSGDKLLGGPQAGFILGSHEAIARINNNPMKRAMRLDKVRLAAAEATLKLYRNPDQLIAKLPTARLLARTSDDCAAAAARLAPKLADVLSPEIGVAVKTCESQVGSGAAPQSGLPSSALVLHRKGGQIQKLAEQLRELPLPIVGRIHAGELWLDIRCLEDEDALIEAFKAFAVR